jgi:hypothetical protein
MVQEAITNGAAPEAAIMVCNGVASEIGTNNLVIIGSFDSMQSNTFPTRTNFYVVAKLWGMPPSDASRCTLKLVERANGKVLAEAGEHRFASKGPDDVHTAISQFADVAIPKSGMYEARAYVGDSVIGRYPLKVDSAKVQ